MYVYIWFSLPYVFALSLFFSFWFYIYKLVSNSSKFNNVR